jgi:dipeptidyl-peptidase-4
MRAPRHAAVGAAIAFLASWTFAPPIDAQRPPSIAQFLSPPYPFDLVAAKKAERVAWLTYEEGKRNVFTAVPPEFLPVRLTTFTEDNGTDISDLSISDNGSVVVFVRGTAPNRLGWVANPTSHPDASERAIWAARTLAATAAAARGRGAAPPGANTPVGTAWRVAEGASPELSPDGTSVLFVREGQIHRALLSTTASSTPRDRGEVPFIRASGTSSSPRWSPDGRKIAFVSNRVDHGFIGVYDMATRTVKWIAPSVDRDTSPAWSADSTQVAFLRRPGLSFGQQAQAAGNAGGGLPPGQPATPNTGRGRSGAQSQSTPARPDPPATAPAAAAPVAPATPLLTPVPPPAPVADRGRNGATPPPPQTGHPVQTTAPPPPTPPAPPPAPEVRGLRSATFRGGYTLSLMVGSVATAEAAEVWHAAPDDRVFGNISTIRWAGKHAVFSAATPTDEWDRYFSLPLDGSATGPVLLTSTDGLIEDATSVAISPDGSTLFYSTNAKDVDRRHVWSVPIAGGTPRQITLGQGIETSPVVLSSGTRIAALTSDAQRPQSVGVFPARGGAQVLAYPTLARTFPLHQHVVPEPVSLTAADGLETHNQLFLPAIAAEGERRPAIVFVHGGPARQMLLGYHYMHFYHMAYAVNQWLANQGYVVLSVNYRSGIGYGRSFRTAPNTGGRGNAEYQDVLAAGRYLQGRADVDPQRIGIWGLSYGGVLTAQALARNSDIFAAGVDLAGVHLWGNSLEPGDISYTSSVIAAIDTWKSPVLLVHGDDDRNVAFEQTTGLVQLLRARDIDYDLIVFPDDTHESLLHSRWIATFGRMEAFLRKHLLGKAK